MDCGQKRIRSRVDPRSVFDSSLVGYALVCATATQVLSIPARWRVGKPNQLHPVVLPQVSHFMQVPLRTSVKLPHSPQASPS